mmetsp:Transcript_35437/g.114716  ORF Transcript_35437/g.114716 Transcript_35437/m.114716 type:complete len:201 (+) Transcript_35437:1285-1887(+)
MAVLTTTSLDILRQCGKITSWSQLNNKPCVNLLTSSMTTATQTTTTTAASVMTSKPLSKSLQSITMLISMRLVLIWLLKKLMTPLSTSLQSIVKPISMRLVLICLLGLAIQRTLKMSVRLAVQLLLKILFQVLTLTQPTYLLRPLLWQLVTAVSARCLLSGVFLPSGTCLMAVTHFRFVDAAFVVVFGNLVGGFLKPLTV